MLQDSAVQASYVTPEIHLQFFHGFVEGNPNYDLLLE